MRKNYVAGITLIALVVTIIVLLILAGISIQMLTGDNGILSRAGEAKDLTAEKQMLERVQLAYLAASTGGKGQVTEQLLRDELDKEFGQNKYELTEDLTKVIIDEKEYDVGGTVLGEPGKKITKDINGTTIAKTDGVTEPWLPTSKAEILNNDLTTGLTIKDEAENEWVWIVVPKSVTESAINDDGIKIALEDYVYVQNAKKIDGTEAETPLLTKTNGEEVDKAYKTTTVGFTDTYYDGCGLSLSDYTKKYSKMLNSIKENGGFYIGKYEAGYELQEGSTNYRSNSNKASTSEHTAVIRQNAYPYNYVTCSQAQVLAEGFATGTKDTTLLFGIQWDLVLKYLNNNGVSISDLTSDSKDLGNYSDTANATLRSGKYTQYSNSSNQNTFNIWHAYTENLGNFINNKVLNNSVLPQSVLLTTGALPTTMTKQNINDIAGNLFEWTLEKNSNNDYLCSARGGRFSNAGSDYPVSYRTGGNTTYAYYNLRFPCCTLLMKT